MDKIKFGSWVKDTRDKKKLKNADIAKLSGISESQVSRIIRGESEPTFHDKLVETAKELNAYSSGFFIFYDLLPNTTFSDVVAHYSKEAAANGWTLNKKDNAKLFMEYKKDDYLVSLIYWPPQENQVPGLQMHWTVFLLKGKQ